MPAKCNCGANATHAYRRMTVCVKCYRAHAALDDNPVRIPKGYDWSAEMDARKLR
ncbi:hypothetical protein [Kutzneria sp. NPDC051319]|uniref:hypothetical protein n=1 Tax=Kutzneria sp. NPDC051319 TaxID=3155047 RepID=UPI00343B48F6